jgi:hypothetical protein
MELSIAKFYFEMSSHIFIGIICVQFTFLSIKLESWWFLVKHFHSEIIFEH